MAISYAVPHPTRSAQRLVSRPTSRAIEESSCYRTGQTGSPRPGHARPGGAPLRYRGAGVAMSTASHRRRPVSVPATAGMALLAGVITLWLGLMASFGSVVTDEPDASAQVPAALAVVRVQPGESLQQLATRVAPGAPVRDVVERIRNLNALDSNSVAAGQTLIAPIG